MIKKETNGLATVPSAHAISRCEACRFSPAEDMYLIYKTVRSYNYDLKRKTNGLATVPSAHAISRCKACRLSLAEDINFLISVVLSLSKGRERSPTNSITVC